MRITFVISSLGAGGAERALVGMANWWHAQGHNVTIITYFDHQSFYELNAGVQRIEVEPTVAVKSSSNVFSWVLIFLQRIQRIRQAITSSTPDCVISFIDKTNILVLMACVGLKYRVIVSERTNPKYYTIGSIQSFIRKAIYRFASVLVIQTASLQSWAKQHVAEKKIAIIPNTLDQQRAHAIVTVEPEISPVTWSYRIIAMGRLTHEKGHDLLLQAYAKLFTAYPDWGLEIIGDGPLRGALELNAKQLGIAQRVRFHGQLKQPFGLIKSADIFVLPSRIEGFPNVLLEAMALGKAVVSFDCPSGPADLIQHDYNGLLVPAEQIEAMAAALEILMGDAAKREALGLQAIHVLERYAEDKVMQLWDQELIR